MLLLRESYPPFFYVFSNILVGKEKYPVLITKMRSTKNFINRTCQQNNIITLQQKFAIRNAKGYVGISSGNLNIYYIHVT